MQSARSQPISSAFIWRRIHSLMGFWLVIYLIEHLIVNSQAALWVSENGIEFVRLVNLIQSIPYLHIIEATLIGIPVVIHGVWGVYRACTARLNVHRTDGSAPSLPYSRNRAFTWQRVTSWILLFGIAGHVVQMRFLEQPKRVWIDRHERYLVKITKDEALIPLSQRLGVSLSDQGGEYFCLTPGEVMANAPDPGRALLLMVRNTFKSPLMVALYTIFVLAAAFHACNGFWTFLITWGAILSYRSQRAMIPVSVVGMGLMIFFGLAAVWGSYWLS
jgi:succinate dehydrogenase / fumarate reductase cytochrome b subunit